MTELHSQHWVTSRIATDADGLWGHPLIRSVLVYGTPANLFLATVLLLRGSAVSTEFLAAIVSGIVWLNVSGYLIWYYDERVLPRFFSQATTLFTDTDRVKQLQAKYDAFFSEYHFVPVVIWIALLVALFFGSEPYLVSNGLFEAGSPLRYLYLGSVFYLGYMSGVGFSGVVTTILAVRELQNVDLEVDPLDPDGLGGLSTIGYFSIRTTLTFSTGSLLLPLAFIFVRGNAPPWLVFVIVAGFIGTILVSFVYPTRLINKKAQQHRDARLEELRKEYRRAKTDALNYSEVESADENTELIKRMELDRVRQEYQDYQNLRLYPFQINILLKLVSSLVLPIFFLVIDSYVL